MFDISLYTGLSNFDISIGESLNNYFDGLMFSYSMESSSSLVDDTGVNDGINTATSLVLGRTGNGLRYNGTSTISNVTSSTSLNSPTTAITLMADIYPTAVGQSSTSVVVGKANNTSGAYSYGIGYNSAKQIRFRIGQSNASFIDVVSTITASLNEWNRIIVRFESDNVRDIRIGSQSETFATASYTMSHTTNDLTIGSSLSPVNRRFTGTIDNVMGWNRLLSTDETDALINNQYTYADFLGKFYIKTNGVFKGFSQFIHNTGVFKYVRPTVIANSPDIVKTGLLANLDATNTLSYPGSGSNWFDISGNSNNGTLITGTTDGFGSVRFDGISGTVNITIDLRRDFSLECWVKYDIVTGFAYFGQGTLTTDDGIHILNQSLTSIRFGMYSNDTDYTVDTLVPNKWYHYIFTYNHSSPFGKQLFQNGIEIIGVEQQVQDSYKGEGIFRIGSTYSAASLSFADGLVSVVRIYDKIITPTEALQNYNATKHKYIPVSN